VGLCLTLKLGATVYIGDDIKITVVQVKKQSNNPNSVGYVRILFDAPKGVLIIREKLLQSMIDQVEDEQDE